MSRFVRHEWCLILIATLLAAGSGNARSSPPDDSPEIVPFRVPAGQVSKWFPDRAELKGMTVEAFDRLIESVREGAARVRAAKPVSPRLLKSKHEISWNQGILEGRSSFVLDSIRSGSQRLLLKPWTPAIDPGKPEVSPIVADDAGDTFLLLDFESRKNATAEIFWKHQARPGSKGRKFSVGLPRTPVREIQIELPKTLRPEGSSPLIRGPFASSRADHWIWLYDGTAESLVLGLVDSEDRDGLDNAWRFWAERTTSLDLREAGASMKSDWSLPEKTRRPSTLRLLVSQGVEILGVSGPEVVDFKIGKDSPLGTILTIRLEEAASNPADVEKTSFSINALVNVPHEGNWIVPTLRPSNGVVTQGSTVVSIGPERDVASLREEDGRRVEPKSIGPADRLTYFFEDEGTGSVATFDFQRAKTDVSVEIRGELFVGNSVPRLETFLSWKLFNGRRFNLDIDLPRAWVADRVEFVGIDEPIAWHPETRPGGEVRIHIALPAGDWSGVLPILKLSAIANVTGGRGSIMLPQIRPVDARIIDETWIANVEEGFRIVPSSAKGLAWIDPATWSPFPSASGMNPPTQEKSVDANPSKKPAYLAWRWLTNEGEARVERERDEESTRATVSELVTLTNDQMELLASVSVQSRAESERSIFIGLNSNAGNPQDWGMSDASSGRELASEVVDRKARADAKIAGEGTTWKVSLPAPTSDRQVINIKHNQPRKANDALPLIVLAGTISSSNVVVVRTSRNLQTRFQDSGVRELDAEVAYEQLRREIPALSNEATLFRAVRAFEYDSKTGGIELHSKSLARSGGLGVIEELRLITTINSAGPVHHRFLLEIAPGGEKSLEIEIPEGAELVDLSKDGLRQLPERKGSTIAVALPSSDLKARPRISIVLDFQTAPTSRGFTQRVVPPRLGFSLPSLATRWQVVVPEEWRLTRWGNSLSNSDPTADPFEGFRTLFTNARHLFGQKRPPISTTKPSIADRLAELELILDSIPAGDIELAALLNRWRSNTSPILIDRFALDEVGVDPATKVRVDASASDRAKALLRNLRSLDLAIYQVGDSLLLTSNDAAADLDRDRSENPDEHSIWQVLISQVLLSGSDSSDRIQTVTRWIEEGSQRSEGVSNRLNSRGAPQVLRNLNHRRSYRFSAIGWPNAGLELRFEDRSFERAWLLGSIPAVLGSIIGGWLWTNPRFRRRLVLSIVLIAFNLFWLLPTTLKLIPIFMFLCLLLLIAMNFTRDWKLRFLREKSDFVLETQHKSSITTVTIASIAGLILLSATATHSLAQLVKSDRIIVLYPYDGPPDPAAKPSRVVMRLTDYDRLDILANRKLTESQFPPEARSIVHRLLLLGSGEIEVATEIELMVSKDQPTHWRFPVGESRKISATADGKSIPITIEAGGKIGEARLDATSDASLKAKGRVALIIKRSLVPRPFDSGITMSLPVNPHPKSRVEWPAEPRGWNPAITRALASETPSGSNSHSALLGPAPLLEIRWERPEGMIAPTPGNSVDALYLWDKTPAGDRLRARLFLKNPGGTNRLRLELVKGLLIRKFDIPGNVDTSLEVKDESSTWEARIDPPLPDETNIEVEFWRPNAPRPATDAPSQDSMSFAPAVQILGAEKTTALLGFRRPPDWVGRLTPDSLAESLTEETFARAWGTLPDESLTLSGALRLPVKENQALWPKGHCEPEIPSLKIQQALKLAARKGRVDFNLDAELFDALGTSHEVRLDFPLSFQIVQVSVEGLTSWRSLNDRSLVIRMDGPVPSKRRLTVLGWIAVQNDPPGLNSSHSECPIPWPKWPGQRVGNSALTVLAASKFELVNSPGAVVVSSDQEGLGTAMGTPNRMTYRVEDPSLLGSLRWQSEPPKVSVRVRGELTIHPDTASWVSRLRYDVSGGPLESIHLKLPTLWARNATVQLLGMSHQKVSESRGEATFWTIRPQEPVWGSVHLMVRSSLPAPSGETIGFPEIGPLGRGEVDTYLALTNATRNPLTIEGSSGLKPVAAAAFDSEDESISEPLNPSASTYYHVTKPGWSLRARRSGPPPNPNAATTEHSEIVLVLGSNGEVLGRCVDRINARQDLFVPVTLPDDEEILSASVNGNWVPTFVSESNQRLIPTDGSPDPVVTLLWRSKAKALNHGQSRNLRFPLVAGRRIPALIRVFAAEGISLADPSRHLVRSSIDRNDLEEASWILAEIRRSLDAIDRGSRADTQSLISNIRRFETKVNEIKRRSSLEASRASEDSVDPISDRAEGLQKELTEALVSFSLEEFQNEARVTLGMGTSTNPPGFANLFTPGSSLSLPRIGKPLEFSGVFPGDASDLSMVWTVDPPPPSVSGVPYFCLGFSTMIAPGIVWLIRSKSSKLVRA